MASGQGYVDFRTAFAPWRNDHFPRRGRVKTRIPKAYAMTVVGWTIAGVVIGDRIFPEMETAFGDTLTDVVFGMLGAVIGALAYEIVSNIRASS
jgi:hypothetical protein